MNAEVELMGFKVCRKINGECAAFTHFALHFDFTLMLLNDVVAYG